MGLVAKHPPRSGLSAKFLAIAADELDHAAHTIGQRILRLYLADLAEAEVMRLTRDPTAIRKIFDRILADDKAAEKITLNGLRLKTTRYYPTSRTRDALTYLMDKVTAHRDMSGISMLDCCALLKRDLHHAIKPDGLRAMLKRNSDYHRLCIRRERVRLQSDMVVQMLGAKYQEQKAERAKEIKPLRLKVKTSLRKPVKQAKM